MATIIDLNKHVAVQGAKAVEAICEPLFNAFNLNHFQFVRTYNDGSRASLHTNMEWTKHYFQNEYFNTSRTLKHPSNYIEGFSLVDGWSKSHPNQVILNDARDNWNIDHGLVIIKKFPEYVEVCAFFAPTDNQHINEVYIKHLEYFERFILYFKDKARNLIKQAEESKYTTRAALETNVNVTVCKPQLDVSTPKVQEFLRKTQPKKVYLDGKFKNRSITFKEAHSVYYLYQGLSYKQIGKILGLSPRTIEGNIHRVINKLGLENRKSLLQESELKLVLHKLFLGKES